MGSLAMSHNQNVISSHFSSQFFFYLIASLDVEGSFSDSVRLLLELEDGLLADDCIPSLERRLPVPNALSAATVCTETSFRASLLEGHYNNDVELCCDSFRLHCISLSTSRTKRYVT